MNIAQIEKNLSKLVKDISKETFIYDLLLAYGTPKATVNLLKKGKRNLSKHDDQIILKKKMFFQKIVAGDLHNTIDTLKRDEYTYRHDPRFIVVTDYKTLLAIDTKTDDTLDIKIQEIIKHPFFFGPWAKIEKTTHANENPADVKAAEKMAKIYDEILKGNEYETKEELHGLNIFLSRMLFCFFAEDTEIFNENQFTNAISSHTQDDGSDLQEYLNKLFEVLNTQDRKSYPEYLHDFKYVNGGLFGESHNAPAFSRKARQMIIECGELDWQDINPDIFGSMFQAVVHKDQRGNMGMHYTSVPNIMKVINPPYLGTRNQEKEHKDDIKNLLENTKNYKTLDYISCWFFKARKYIQKTKHKAAFVSTNSICQGDQTSILWPLILKNDVEIIFAHQSFKWANNAKKNAGVICVIIGIGSHNQEKRLFNNGQVMIVKNIQVICC